VPISPGPKNRDASRSCMEPLMQSSQSCRATPEWGQDKRRLPIADKAGPVALAKPRRRLGSMKGQSLVEFAVVALLFFLLVFSILDFGRLFFVQMALQDAVREAGRFAVTGNKLPDPKDPKKTLSRVESIILTAQQEAPGLDIKDIKISCRNGGNGSAGGPGDTVTISVTDDLQLVTPIIGQFFDKGVYRFTVSVSFKNEPFDPADRD
jgi:hypothetical protein